MALLPILEAPHPILSQKARPVNDSEFGPEAGPNPQRYG